MVGAHRFGIRNQGNGDVVVRNFTHVGLVHADFFGRFGNTETEERNVVHCPKNERLQQFQ